MGNCCCLDYSLELNVSEAIEYSRISSLHINEIERLLEKAAKSRKLSDNSLDSSLSTLIERIPSSAFSILANKHFIYQVTLPDITVRQSQLFSKIGFVSGYNKDLLLLNLFPYSHKNFCKDHLNQLYDLFFACYGSKGDYIINNIFRIAFFEYIHTMLWTPTEIAASTDEERTALKKHSFSVKRIRVFAEHLTEGIRTDKVTRKVFAAAFDGLNFVVSCLDCRNEFLFKFTHV